MTPARNAGSFAGMSNVLGDDKQHQIVALGRLGWSLRRIERDDRCPARDGQRLSEGRGHRGAGPRAAAANQGQNRPFPRRRCPPTLVAKPAISEQVSTDSGEAKPATRAEVSTDSAPVPRPGRAPSASACEPYRELIAEALGRGPQRHGHLAGPRRRPRLHRAVCERAALRRDAPRDVVARGARRDHDRARRRRPGRLRRWPDGAPSADRQVPAHAALRPDARLLAQSGPPAGVAVEHAGLGRAPRARVSSARRHGPRHRPRQSQRRRPHPGHLRSRAQSALPRRARALRRRRAAVSRRRSRSQGQSRSRRRAREEDAASRAALRIARRGASVSRSLGSALGRHAHPRHDEAPGRRDVCRGAARARPAAARAVSLLPLRRPHRAPRWLRRGRGRVLRHAAGLDRSARRRAVERPLRPPARSEDRSAPARACARPARLAPHRRCRSPATHAAEDGGAARSGHAHRASGQHHLRSHPPPRR